MKVYGLFHKHTRYGGGGMQLIKLTASLKKAKEWEKMDGEENPWESYIHVYKVLEIEDV